VKLIPDAVMMDCPSQAQLMTERPTSRGAFVVIVAIWVGAVALTTYLFAMAFDLI